jgi:hypothetical protein
MRGVIRAVGFTVGMRIWACVNELCVAGAAHVSVSFGKFPRLLNEGSLLHRLSPKVEERLARKTTLLNFGDRMKPERLPVGSASMYRSPN